MYIIATFLGLLNWIPVNPWSEMKTNIHYVTIDYEDIQVIFNIENLYKSAVLEKLVMVQHNWS